MSAELPASPSDPSPAADAPSRLPAAVVALASWLVPGSGYLLLGQWARGITISATVIGLYVMGLWVGGVRVVEAPPNYLRQPVNAIMQRPWFAGQVLMGPMTLYLAKVVAEHSHDWITSHSRVNEIGTLYTAIAGMLNLLAIIDSAHRAAYGAEPSP